MNDPYGVGTELGTHTHTHKVHVKVRKSEQDQWIVLMSIF